MRKEAEDYLKNACGEDWIERMDRLEILLAMSTFAEIQVDKTKAEFEEQYGDLLELRESAGRCH